MREADRELWLLAGQSNMEGQGDQADGPYPHPLVRAFTLARRWEPAREPLHWPAESPDPVHHRGATQTPEEARQAKLAARKGVGPGLWFGRLRAETGRQIDLVCAAQGGTSLAEWLPRPDAAPGTTLYGSMLESIRQAGGPLTGVLWYQGCNDTNPADAAAYGGRMELLVASLRRDLDQPELPWIAAQIGRTVGRREDQESWNAVREAQLRLPVRIPGLTVVSTVDLELDDWIHLSARAQRTLACRFADAARYLVDRVPGALPPPRPAAAHWDPEGSGDWVVRVDFDHVSNGWGPAGLPRGFTLCDASGRDQEVVVRTRIEGSRVFLRTSTDDLAGLCVAYAVGPDPAANLVDARGQGLLAFRGLPLSGLPPVTPWVRCWSLHRLTARTLTDAVVPGTHSPDWQPVTVEGWWYLVLSDWWSSGAVAGRTAFCVTEPMDVEFRIGNDVPFRLYLDGVILVEEGPGPRLTSTNIDFEHHRRSVPLEPGDHEVTFVAVPRSGGLGLDLRLARTDASSPLPILLDHQKRRLSP